MRTYTFFYHLPWEDSKAGFTRKRKGTIGTKLPRWEYPTMKIAAVDQKRRVVLPKVKEGEYYAVVMRDPGHYELTK